MEEIAASLRSGLGIDDVSLKKALVGAPDGRLDDLEAAVSRVQDMLFGTLPELAPTVPWRQLVVHLAQWRR